MTTTAMDSIQFTANPPQRRCGIRFYQRHRWTTLESFQCQRRQRRFHLHRIDAAELLLQCPAGIAAKSSDLNQDFCAHGAGL
jgi:hypothetical protein